MSEFLRNFPIIIFSMNWHKIEWFLLNITKSFKLLKIFGSVLYQTIVKELYCFLNFFGKFSCNYFFQNCGLKRRDIFSAHNSMLVTCVNNNFKTVEDFWITLMPKYSKGLLLLFGIFGIYLINYFFHKRRPEKSAIFSAFNLKKITWVNINHNIFKTVEDIWISLIPKYSE